MINILFIRRRIQGLFYFGVLIPLTFIGLSAMIVADGGRRLFARLTAGFMPTPRERIGAP